MPTEIIYTYAECDAAPSLSCSVDGAAVQVTGEPSETRAECSGPRPHRWVFVIEASGKAGWKSA
jgi:hypothetical protein